jgi:cyclic AMP-responsive element-binding protein 3
MNNILKLKFIYQISAQESRRKKKEFVDTLERKVEEASAELGLYKKKCEHLQKENSALVDQVKSLRAMLERKAGGNKHSFKMEPDEDEDGKIKKPH